MNYCLANWANFSTIVLAVAAIIAGLYAVLNLRVLKKRHRYDILFSLMDRINSKDERKNKAIIHQAWQSRGWDKEDKNSVARQIDELIKGIWEADAKGAPVKEEDRKLKNAIEETVACLDTVGFFLLENDDTKIMKEAPQQIWSIAKDFWEKFSAYIEIRRKRNEVWGTHFEKLGIEATKKKK